MVTLATVEKALKELYLGAIIKQLNTESDPFIARIQRTSERITGNNGIVRDAQIGINGGFGAGTETGALPLPGENIYKKLTSTTKNMYGVIAISDKALKSLKANDKGAFGNLIQREITGMMETGMWHFARQVSGKSDGVLTTCRGTSSGNTIAVNDVRLLIEGITIDILSTAGSPVATARRITNVNRSTNEITIGGASVSTTAGMLITAQGSYKLELTGLGDLFDLSSTTLYGNTRADNDWLNPYVKENTGVISDALLTEAIMRQEDAYNVNINYLRAGNEAYHAYAKYLEQRVKIVNTTKLEGGYTALKFGEHPFVRNKFMEPDSIDFLDTSKFYLDQVSEWDWIPGPVNGIFVQVAGTPTYTATLAKYADLMCVTPGGMARYKGITAPAETAAGD